MAPLREDMTVGKVKYRGRWRTCLYHDNGDGTARVVVGRGSTVHIGNKSYIGTVHTLPIESIKEER